MIYSLSHKIFDFSFSLMEVGPYKLVWKFIMAIFLISQSEIKNGPSSLFKYWATVGKASADRVIC